MNALKYPYYIALSIVVAMAVIIFAAWLPNLHLVTHTMTSADMTLWEKTNFLASLLGSLQTNFTPLSRALTIASALLIGIQVSLFTFYMRKTVKLQRAMGTSLLGMISSMVGIGCASCGSVVLTSLLGFSATAGILGVLPFKGQEFSFLGITLLILAIILTIKKIRRPLYCR